MNASDHWDYIKRHLHDMRNHINGLEMEAMLLDSVVPDENTEAKDAAARISVEVALIEAAFKGLAARFAPLNLQVVSAVDLFTAWRSRCAAAGLDSAHEWRCEVANELVRVDLKIVADILCELLPDKTDAAEISATASEGGVRFQVRQEFAPGAPALGKDSVRPGWEEVIARNGGRCELAGSNGETAGSRVRGCWFPCASASESS